MSFLNQLKTQANALQNQESGNQQTSAENLAQTEAACLTTWLYLSELAKQLNIIAPAGPEMTLDGKTRWPTMKLVDFRADCRKKMLLAKEVYDSLSLGWQIVPKIGKPVGGSVSANFLPDLQRIEERIKLASLQHERKEIRHPEKNTLLALEFEYLTQCRASVMVTPEHDKASLCFRLVNTAGFGVITTRYPAKQIQTPVLDELAKLLVGQPSRFV
ncbi:MAG: hypothetical protein ACKVOO_08730 [Burkholderiaceae bacterium]